MSNNPSISVVIPTFNRAQRTIEAIESALGQTLTPLEVIVVDDHSTDDTFEILTAKFGHVVNLIKLDRNIGGAGARNAGASVARGQYIAFLDSDDIWFKDKLRMQYEHYRKRAQSDFLAIAYCRADIDWHLNGPTFCPARGIAVGEKVEDYIILNEQDIQTSGLFMPLWLFNAVKFKEGLARHQDIDFVIRAQKTKVMFIYVDESLYLRRRDDTNLNVGRLRNDDISLNWILSVKSLIGRRAYHRFMWNRVMPLIAHRKPLAALRYALVAQLAGEPALIKLVQIARGNIGARSNQLAARFRMLLNLP